MGDGWALGVAVPWVRPGDGILDSTINQFHDVTGLPDGGRSDAPGARLRYLWRQGGRNRVNLAEPRSGLGDVRVSIDHQLLAGNERALAVRGTLEAPTGDPEALTGGDEVDASLALHASDGSFAGWPLVAHTGAAVVRLGDDGASGPRLEHWVGWGSLALAWPLGRRLTLKGQLDAHTRLLNTDVDKVGGWGVQGSLAGAWSLATGWSLELSFQEDLRPGASSDIAFAGVLRKRW